MAAGPYPCTQMMPKSSGGLAFAYNYVGGGGGDGDSEMMMGVAASLSADTYWVMRCSMPATLPSGTATLRLWTRTTGTGNAKINPKWASTAAAEDPGSITLNAEGTTTQAYAAGDIDEYVKIDITLDADTVVGGERLVIVVVFETTSWTLDQALGVLAEVVFV